LHKAYAHNSISLFSQARWPHFKKRNITYDNEHGGPFQAAWEMLEKNIGIQIKAFAYPYGEAARILDKNLVDLFMSGISHLCNP
jgi:hypothetical protein